MTEETNFSLYAPYYLTIHEADIVEYFNRLILPVGVAAKRPDLPGDKKLNKKNYFERLNEIDSIVLGL